MRDYIHISEGSLLHIHRCDNLKCNIVESWTTVKLEFDSQQEQDTFLFSTAFKLALGSIQSPTLVKLMFSFLSRGGRQYGL
jgi:hypothetical protein